MNIRNLGSFTTNNYLLTLPNGYMLVDTGYADSFPHFLQQLSKQNIPPTEIKYLFLTHAHDDHAGYLNPLLSLHPSCKIILHPNAIAGLRRGQNSFQGGCSSLLAYTFCQAMALFGKGKHQFPIIEPRFEPNYICYGTAEAQELEQTLSMQFIETPGHTNCSISLLYNNVLFCGDAAMNGLPSLKRITIWLEDPTTFYHSWEKIISLKPKSIYPGHGKPFPYSNLQTYLPHVKQIKTYPL